MDQEKNTENPQGCGCEPGSACCQPKKPTIWKKLIFGLVLVIAVVIIIFKVSHRNDSMASGTGSSCSDTTQCCGDQSKSDTTKPCCP